MNKKKLTLLIALSIIIVILIVTLSAPSSAAVNPKEEGKSIVTSQQISKIEMPPASSEPEPEPVPVSSEPAAARSVAGQVWDAMKAKGWSDNLCAGIMGNMMAECGGNTLNLNPYIVGDSGTSFGLCQWHAGRKNNLIKNYGKSIEAQIEFLSMELQKYPKILNSTKSYKEIAYDFCIYFERPKNSHSKAIYRKQLAEIAYNEFANK